MKEKIVIIDGNSLVNQAFFATQRANMTTKDGTPTNAVYGFINMMLKIRSDMEPTGIAVAFDLKGPTFRHKQFDGYKANRKGMPDDLAIQMPILKDMLTALGICQMGLSGFEADDLIGTTARICEEQGWNVVVVTGDQDALQLVSSRTSVYLKGRKREILYTPDKVLEDYGVPPERIVDLKGLQGDTSDNIPGVPGVGPKTAVKLLDVFETVDNLIQNWEKIENKRIRNLVAENREQAVLSKKLATIETRVPLAWNPEDVKITPPDTEKLLKMIQEYEFHSLIKRIPELTSSKEQTQSQAIEVEVLSSCEKVKSLVETIRKEKKCSFYTIYDKQNVRIDKLWGLAVWVEEKSYYLPLNGDEQKIEFLKQIFEDETIEKTTYESKRDYLIFQRYGIGLKNVKFDGFVALYLIEPGRRNYDICEVAMGYLSLTLPTEKDILGTGKKRKLWSEIDEEVLSEYGAKAVEVVEKLRLHLEPSLEEMGLVRLFEKLEMPLVPILADIEYQGFSIDTQTLRDLDVELSEKIEHITEDIYNLAGETFNINSPKQLGTILFDKLDLPVIKKTKTGYSTNHDVLQKLLKKHAIVPAVIEYRQYTKLKSTYVDGLYGLINETTGKIHTSLNQTVAVTGRLSSTEPNLQNIPIRLPLGRRLRKVFVASSGHALLDADYSQIELRVLAHMSEDKSLIGAFKNDVDIHSLTASQVFHTDIDEVSSLERSRAKEVNFGIVYGMSDYGLSENLHITRKEAKNYIDAYFKTYPSVKEYMDGQIDFCKKNGYVQTLFKRRRYIPEIQSKNFNLRGFGERTAMNTPIQGSAADIIKMAMIKVFNALCDGGFKSKLILQVHDELILDVLPEEEEAVKNLLKTNMEKAIEGFVEYELSVPLKVDMKMGESWYDTK